MKLCPLVEQGLNFLFALCQCHIDIWG